MRFFGGRFLIGLAILIAGILLLLNNLVEEVDINIWQILDYWPVIPLLIGLNWLLGSFGSSSSGEEKKVFFSWGQFISALIAIAVGIVFLGRNLGLFHVDLSIFWNMLWPVVLILAGISLLKGRAAGSGGQGRFAFMGGSNIGDQPWKLEGGSYFAFMGGIEMDVTTAEIPAGETILDLTAIMGGVDVKIPPGLPVIYEGSAVLGGVTFKDQEDGGIFANRKIEYNLEDGRDNKVLRIQARAIMGGVEIKESPLKPA